MSAETCSSDNNPVDPTPALSDQQRPGDGDTRYPKGMFLGATLATLFLGTLLMALDTTIISVATPQITSDFASLDQIGWYGSAYLITLTAFQPVFGKLYRLFDPVWTYVASIVVFEVGSTLCAASPSSPTFIGGRAIAGVGAAGLLQGALGVIVLLVPLTKRAGYMALVFSVFGIFSTCGPIIGGALTSRVSWRWCFWINLPVGGLELALSLLFLRRIARNASRPKVGLFEKIRQLDPVGILLLLGAVSCLFIALQEGGLIVSWNSARVIGLLIGFGLLAILFAVLQTVQNENALVPVRFLKQRTVAFGSGFLFCDNMSNYMKLYYMPFYFQAVLGHSALQSGIDYVSLAAPQLVALLLSGALINRTGQYMPFICLGQVLCIIGTGFLTKIGTGTPTALWATFMALAGFGLGLGINAPHVAIQGVMDNEDDVFIANGVATFFSQLGGSLAISIGQALLLYGLSRNLRALRLHIDPMAVIKDGPASLSTLAQNGLELEALRRSYAVGVDHAMIFALAILCVSLPTACGMEWLNLKTISEQRDRDGPREEK